jgi:GT2 family glycosyltransferase/SAM-dependent methyltransferase
MTVSAIIPVHNRLKETQCVVELLRRQSFHDLQIVVVDDGSTDGTAEYLAAQRDVLHLCGNGDLWWAGAVELALRCLLPKAKDSDYMLLLNSDTSFDQGYVSKLVAESERLGGAVVGSVLRDASPPHDLISIGPIIDVWRNRVRDHLDDLTAEERAAPRSQYKVDALSGRGTLYPVKVLRVTGTLRPRLLPHYLADYELSARAKRKGFQVMVSTAAVVLTAHDFGVHRRAGSRLMRWFGRGSAHNLLHFIIFYCLIGTPLQRLTAIPRMVAYLIWGWLPRPARKVLRAGALLAASPFSPVLRARLRTRIPLVRPRTYNEQHALIALSHVRTRRARVLVVGCNIGEDCRLFVKLGALRVEGLDVIPEIGHGYHGKRVGYFRNSAESIAVHDNTYDLVFCFATMEHVSRIDRAFPELARVTRPGGIVYCVSSPLWNSRFGHHKGDLFADYPWIHLRLDEADINRLCTERGISDPTGRFPMSVHIAYMLDQRHFNKTPAQRYLEVCYRLPNVKVLRNDLTLDPDDVLATELAAELGSKGYSRTELLAVTHTFIGRKLLPETV